MPHPAEVEGFGFGGLLYDLDYLRVLWHRLHERHRRVVAQQVAETRLLGRGQVLTGDHQYLVLAEGLVEFFDEVVDHRR